MQQIHQKLEQYGKLDNTDNSERTDVQIDKTLLRSQSIQDIKRPTPRAQQNLHNFIVNTRSLVGDEQEWTREGPDLAALSLGPEYSWLNNILADLTRKFSMKAALVSKQELPSWPQKLRCFVLALSDLCTAVPFPHKRTTDQDGR